MEHNHKSKQDYFGQDLIDAYANKQLATTEFVRQYSMRSGTDETGAAEEALENAIENDLYALCVQYEDPMENKIEVELELRELAQLMTRSQ